MSEVDKRLLEEERLALQNEVYGGKLNIQEVPVDVFVLWYRYRMDYQPQHDGTPLREFDLESVMGLFEDWVKEGTKPK